MGELAIGSEAVASPGDAACGASLARPSLRDHFNAWFVTHEVAWELAMAALAVVYVALGFIVDDAIVLEDEMHPRRAANGVGGRRRIRPRG